MSRNGWLRFPGGSTIERPFLPGVDGDVVKPGGVRDKDGMTTLYVGQTGDWKCLAIDPRSERVEKVGRGTSQKKAFQAAFDTSG